MDKLSILHHEGFGLVSKQVLKDKRLHVTSKAIYAYICSYAGNKSVAFPSRNRITEDLCISNDTFNKYLKQLIHCGYLKVFQKKEKGKFSHNEYILCDQLYITPELFLSNIKISTEVYTYFINNILNKSCPILENYLQDLSYEEFLNTAYWKCISKYLKEIQPHCQICGVKENLNIHHKTYKNHTKEHLLAVMQNDLEVLCEKCHKVEHILED